VKWLAADSTCQPCASSDTYVPVLYLILIEDYASHPLCEPPRTRCPMRLKRTYLKNPWSGLGNTPSALLPLPALVNCDLGNLL